MKSWTLAARHARSTSAKGRFGLPYEMLAVTEASKRAGVWETVEMWSRSQVVSELARRWSLRRISPDVGS